MKKHVLSLAIAAAMVPGFAAAADTSGFADINYTITKDSADTVNGNTAEGKFGANGEVDFSASPANGVTTRVDVNLNLDPSTSDSGAAIEQAFFAWNATEGVTVIGGVFNDPIGAEAEDVTDRKFYNHGVVYNILDNQTALDGDNIAGLAVAGAVGPVTLTAAYLNDLQQVNEENSMALIANYSPIKGLDLELGMVTQKGGAGDVINFNAGYAIEQVKGLSIGMDYLQADNVVDSALEVYANYDVGNGVGVGARYESVAWENGMGLGQDTTRTTVNVSYQVASNLKAVLEIASGDVASAPNMATTAAVSGVSDQNTTMLGLVAKF